MGLIEIWTIVAIILHFAGVGDFATWPVIASPFSWSCLCLEMWVFILYIAFFVFIILGTMFGKK
jgi:hypothetical protein